MNTSQNSNIYAFDAASALTAYGAFVQGTPNCTLAVIAAKPLSAEARTALASSAERLGFGRNGVFWVTCEGTNGDRLDANGLQELLVACDPLAFVAMDAEAAEALESAFGTFCPLNECARLQGRPVVAFANFQDMLSAPEAKQRAWALLKKLG